jgi:hypothetical protein
MGDPDLAENHSHWRLPAGVWGLPAGVWGLPAGVWGLPAGGGLVRLRRIKCIFETVIN